jgi:hypothetical protein
MTWEEFAGARGAGGGSVGADCGAAEFRVGEANVAEVFAFFCLDLGVPAAGATVVSFGGVSLAAGWLARF